MMQSLGTCQTHPLEILKTKVSLVTALHAKQIKTEEPATCAYSATFLLAASS